MILRPRKSAVLPFVIFPLVFSYVFSRAESWPPALPPASEAALPLPALPQPAEWTVMYFINGKNDLESSAMMDLNQLELVGSGAKVKITAELGRMNGQEGDDQSEGGWTGVRRYLVTKDADTARINSPVLQDLGAADMGSWKELAAFINWSKANYPARRYALVLWDHGNGWLPVDDANSGDFYNLKGFSLDDETGREFSLPQMAEALRVTGGVDFLMLDGCNMQMASVAYELRGAARVLTASEETEPGVIVRYAQYHRLLEAKPSMDAEEFAVNTVRTYRDFFTGLQGDNEGAPATQSALRLDRLAPLREKLDAWASAALKTDPAALRYARAKAKLFGEWPEYRDLYDFISLASSGSSDKEFKARGQEVLRYLKSDVVLENWAQDSVSHGLAIYVPETYNPLYDGLAFSRDGLWDTFAKYMATLK
ncbi:MAG: hypothetical protein A2089_12505 [Elusimicrobia bacterium GWD2_63_28]|nr:MAG: hypothetical protein A2089_12505 [Elusimicrobia bacterium GWD2_63_28]